MADEETKEPVPVLCPACDGSFYDHELTPHVRDGIEEHKFCSVCIVTGRDRAFMKGKAAGLAAAAQEK